MSELTLPAVGPSWKQRLFPNRGDAAPAIADALTRDYVTTDGFFMKILVAHWVAAATVFAVTHGTWLLGLLGGGAIVGFAWLGVRGYGGKTPARCAIAASLMLFTALFVQQMLGRIEMHFHVFIALAMLIRYKDLAPLLTGAGVIAVHHLAFNYCQAFGVSLGGMPIIVFDYGFGLPIVLLHAAFVVVAAGVYGSIIVAQTHQFMEATALAEEMRDVAAARDRSSTELEAIRQRERDEAAAVAAKVDALLASVQSASR